MNSGVEQPVATVGINPVEPPAEIATEATRASSYRQILKSSALIGSSSVFNVAIGIVRTKVMALVLGPGGFGLMGMYSSLTGMVGTFTILGMDSSAVRQIAEAAGSTDETRIARTITALRRVMLISGCTGALLLFLLRQTASQVTFGDTKYAASIGLLSLTVLFASIAGGQKALIQGLRRLKQLAYINVLGALFGTVVSIPLVLWLGDKGIAPSLLAISAFSMFPSWWFARQVKVVPIKMAFREILNEAQGMLKLGFCFLATGLLGAFVTYASRFIVLHQIGLSSTGIYQAAVTLSGIYVSFILQAIGADFYPRLTAAAKDNAECNRLMNEQIEVAVLLALPGILATIAVAPLILNLFYSSKFLAAGVVVQWQALGVLLQIMSFPLFLIILAKGSNRGFLAVGTLSSIINLVLIIVGVKLFGLPGTGIAFFIANFVYLLTVLAVARRFSRFSWSRSNLQIGIIALVCVSVTFAGCRLFPGLWSEVVGCAVAALIGAWSGTKLLAHVPNSRPAKFVERVAAFRRLSRPRK